MKRTLYNMVAAAFLAGGMTACADFLEIEPQTEILEENFWNAKGDVDGMVAGCYQTMQGDAILKRMMVWGEFRSENLSPGHEDVGNRDASLEKLLKENLQPNNGYTYWGDFYNVINRCNLIIERAPGVAERDPSYTESELRATIAEVSALRDLCYFYLIRTFRDVPYTTEPYVDDAQVMTLPVTRFDDILDWLIADLEAVQYDAVRVYPENKLNYQTGRITQEAIHAILCEMYLWKKDYANCIRYADLVIDAKKRQKEERENQASGGGMKTKDLLNGFPLISHFVGGNSMPSGQVYNSIFGEGGSEETIFELTFDKDRENMPSNGAVNILYGNAKMGMGYARPSTFITEDVTSKVYNIFSNEYDARYSESVSESMVGKYVYSGMATTSTDGGDTWKLSFLGMYPENRNRSNWIIYRLADIMLLKAEALVQTVAVTDGSNAAVNEANRTVLTEAFTLVNAVNKRALIRKEENNSNYRNSDTLKLASYVNSKSAMEELVLKERHRELMFEGKRWFDLVRAAERDGNTTKLAAAVTRKFSSTAALVRSKLAKMDAIYWPINTEELKVNPNLKQNPAYGSSEEEGSYSKTE